MPPIVPTTHVWSTLATALLLGAALPGRAVAQAGPVDDGQLEAVGERTAEGDFGAVTSLLLAVDGRVVYERYFDEGGRDALRNTRSATKTVAGMLAGIAADRGLIRGAAEPVAAHFPELRPFRHPRTTR